MILFKYFFHDCALFIKSLLFFIKFINLVERTHKLSLFLQKFAREVQFYYYLTTNVIFKFCHLVCNGKHFMAFLGLGETWWARNISRVISPLKRDSNWIVIVEHNSPGCQVWKRDIRASSLFKWHHHSHYETGSPFSVVISDH